MITIDQLLESVDLDFEPRWVTKSRSGYVEIWSNKPKAGATTWYYISEDTISQSICKLKLAEFDGKDWTECIYEVPRKTTGKIEKMLEQKLTIGKTKYEYPTHAMLMDKINELVDAVNNIVGAQNKIITEKKPAECEPVANIDRCETPTPDSFEESKKWIGCLCKVWDIDEQKCEYVILQEVKRTGRYKYKTSGVGSLWCKCKPVCPNDNIIYKGGEE